MKQFSICGTYSVQHRFGKTEYEGQKVNLSAEKWSSRQKFYFLLCFQKIRSELYICKDEVAIFFERYSPGLVFELVFSFYDKQGEIPAEISRRAFSN